jgi:hypothetical protein
VPQVSVNHLADRTDAELNKRNGVVPAGEPLCPATSNGSPMPATSQGQRVRASASAAPSGASSYPAAFSWVDKGKVSSVKDQGFDCASCWAFTTAAVMESAFAIASASPPLDLSPQSLVDCFTQFAGCHGGRQPVRWEDGRGGGGGGGETGLLPQLHIHRPHRLARSCPLPGFLLCAAAGPPVGLQPGGGRDR